MFRSCLLLSLFGLFGCPSGGTEPMDGAPGPCTTDDDCDDGVFCNGVEQCTEGACTEGAAPCAGGCDELADMCEIDCEMDPDPDDDGVRSIECGGGDCDDTDGNRFPGNVEVCDSDDHDEDCDPLTFGSRDRDGDGWPDGLCCNVSADGDRECGSDCDDSRPDVRPDGTETCDGQDNDCDGSIDEGVERTFYRDADGDGFGSADSGAATMFACNPPDGYAENATDCDDDAGSVNPAAMERCDAAEVDDDCDGERNESCDCITGISGACDAPGRCASGSRDCVDGVWGDCSIMPAAETCNFEDDDCDGTTDESSDGGSLQITCYADIDRDGIAPLDAATTPSCSGACPDQTVRMPASGFLDADCDDMDASNGRPVDGKVDNDGDGYGRNFQQGCPGPNFAVGASRPTDCDDANPDVFPGQTAYFVAPSGTGCPEGMTAICDQPDGRMTCGTFEIAGSPPRVIYYCDPIIEVGPIWNYDCNRDPQKPPLQNSCSSCAPGGCVDGYDYSGGQQCGDTVTYYDCFSSFCGGSMTDICMLQGTATRQLPCR